jgi:hypothetical protein
MIITNLKQIKNIKNSFTVYNIIDFIPSQLESSSS